MQFQFSALCSRFLYVDPSLHLHLFLSLSIFHLAVWLPPLSLFVHLSRRLHLCGAFRFFFYFVIILFFVAVIATFFSFSSTACVTSNNFFFNFRIVCTRFVYLYLGMFRISNFITLAPATLVRIDFARPKFILYIFRMQFLLVAHSILRPLSLPPLWSSASFLHFYRICWRQKCLNLNSTNGFGKRIIVCVFALCFSFHFFFFRFCLFFSGFSSVSSSLLSHVSFCSILRSINRAHRNTFLPEIEVKVFDVVG